MRVLVVNCGSSSLKFRLSETLTGSSSPEERLAWGTVDGVGDRGTLKFVSADGATTRATVEVADHEAAAGRVLGWLGEHGILEKLEAVGHRVVDGGTCFVAPTLVDNEVTAAIGELKEMAPLHNGPALATIRAAREALDPDVPMVATIEDGSPEELIELLTDTIEGQIRERFEHVMRLKEEAYGQGVEEMREYVEAMLGLEVYSHTLYECAHAEAHGEGDHDHEHAA